MVACGAGEGAAHVAEELRFEQRFRDRTAVERHERRVAARARPVDRLREEFLAGAAVAADQHARIAGRDELRPRELRLEDRVVRDDAGTPRFAFHFRSRWPREAHGALDQRDEFLAVEGLRQIVEHAAAHRGDGVRDAPVGRQDDHRQRGVRAMQFVEERHAVGAAHAQVGHDHPRRRGRDPCEGFLGAAARHDVEAGGRQPDRHEPEEVRVVVDHQHPAGVFADPGITALRFTALHFISPGLAHFVFTP